MKYTKFIKIFLLVLIIIGIGLLLTQKMWVPKLVDMILGDKNIKVYVDTTVNVNKTFTNETYRYSFEYPKNYLVYNTPYRQDSDQTVYNPELESAPQQYHESTIHIRAEKNYFPNASSSDKSFLNGINGDFGLKGFCDNGEGDGPSIKLADIVKQTKYTNKNGLMYYETYLKMQSFTKEGTRNLGISGPFYAFDVSEPSEGKADVVYVFIFSNCSPKANITPASLFLSSLVESFKF